MIKKVIGTFGTRIVCTLLTLGVVVINSNSFGSDGVGIIGLFVLNVTILQIVGCFVGGPSLIYMLPRYDNFRLLFLSYFFSFLTTVLGTFLLYTFHLVSSEYVLCLFFSSFFVAFFYINSFFLLSQENFKLYNFFAIFQILIHLGILALFVFLLKIVNVYAYMTAYCISHLLSFSISFYFVAKKVRYNGFDGIFQLLKKMFQYGFLIQIANLAQLLNYRFSYYMIKFAAGLKPLGLFDIGTKLSEAVWILPKSAAMVQLARISNCKDDKVYAKKITLSFLKLVFIFALAAVFLLYCIPAQWLGWIFGSEFIESKKIIYALGCGIIVFSCNAILAHYFSGFGNYKINTIGSLIGLAITVGLSLSLIPWFHALSGLDIIFIIGLITSLSYTGSSAYSLICFVKDTNLKISELKINRQDFLIIKTELKKLLKIKTL
ncbi:MAG: hypothetical protein FWH36_05095 [Lentimicrobiaceae bacterium]|nr:hypothetical protein [Lentimicrobiaceae bacterium]